MNKHAEEMKKKPVRLVRRIINVTWYPKSRVLLTVVATLIGAAIYGITYRSRQIEQLFVEASDQSPFDVVKKQQAIRKLARVPDKRATALLLRIVFYSDPSDVSGGRETAISALSDRGDPIVADQMSELLQLHQPIATRKAVAKALLKFTLPWRMYPFSPEL